MFPDDILVAAREAIVKVYGERMADEIYAGGWDDYGMTQAAAYAIATERARNAWQPIETAPRDGTSILVRLAQGLPQNFRHLEGRYFVAKFLVGGDWALFPGFGANDQWIDGWMPLPQPPKGE